MKKRIWITHVAGTYAYILQTPERHDVRTVGCRVAELK